MGGIQRCGMSARYVMETYGREARRHVLDLAHIAVRNGPDADDIELLAWLMRQIEANEHQQIREVARRFAV